MDKNIDLLTNAAGHGHFEVDPQALKRKQIHLIYGQLPLILLADVVMGGFLFALILSSSHGPFAYFWITVIIISSTARALIAGYHRRRPMKDDDLANRLGFLITGAFVSGATWGSSWILLPSDPALLQIVLVIMWLSGMQAGAVTVMTSIWRVFLAYSVPAWLSLVSYILLAVAQYKFALAGACVVYLCFIIPIAHRISRDFNNAIRLQIHNSQLLASLKQEAERLKQKERDLEAQRRKSETLEHEKESVNTELRAATHEKLLILDAIGEGVFGINERGYITFTNATALTMLGCPEEDLLGVDVLALLSGSNTKGSRETEVWGGIRDCLREGKESHNIEATLARGEEYRLPVRLSCKPIMQNDETAGAVISFADVSGQKEMEAMLVQSQKMEAIGRLTGGVAHDFNNLLTVIIGNLHFLKRKMAADETIAPLLQKIMDAAQSGGQLSNRLLSFSREQPLEFEYIDVNELIDGMKGLLAPLLGEDIHLEIDAQAGTVATRSDRSQLQNAILNLCVNAREAMPHGGRLTIATKIVHLQNSFVQGDDSRGENEYMEISVTDTGTGIPADVQKRIFDPFFSTKSADEGSGLGLATVYGFIRQCGGNIIVNSREGEWTRFRIYLPISAQGVVERPRGTDKPADREDIKFAGTVLVVEDNPGVREAAVNNLKQAGYDVVQADDGIQGLAQFKTHPGIDLVFSDVIMPGGMNGIEMAERMLAITPQMPVILVSGYTDKSLRERVNDLPNVLFLSKPYDPDGLPALVHSMLKRGKEGDANQSVR